MRTFPRNPRKVGPALLALTLISCASPKMRVPRDNSVSMLQLTPLSPDASTPDAPKRQLVPASVAAHLVAVVPEKTIGPFVARRGGSAMAAYIDVGDQGERRVVAVPLGADGETKTQARVVASATNEPTMLVVRPMGGERPAFVAAWTALTERGEALSIVTIGEDGAPHGAPIELARTNDDVVWVDMVATSRGVVCVWAEETRAGDANVLAAAIDADGRLHGSPSRIIRGVTAWQVVAAPNGVGLATVNASSSSSRSESHGGTLSWMRLGEDARPAGTPVTIVPRPTVSGDVDVVRDGAKFVFAWTDRSATDPFVATASLDDAGRLQGPERVVDPSEGGSTLVDLAAGPLGVALAWEEPVRRGGRTRRMHLVHLDPGGGVDARAKTIFIQGDGAAELVGTSTGYGLLATMRPCEAERLDACANADPIATFARFDRLLDAVQTEPLRTGESRDPVLLAWGLSCEGERCSALAAATSTAPVKIVSTDLVPRKTIFVPPTVPRPPPDAPQLGLVTSLAAGPEFADLAATRVADGTLIATLTASVDDAHVERNERGATLSVRALDATGGGATGPVYTISTRALTAGGVAMAAGGTPDDGAAVAWVAREAGDPQVHVSRVDKHGKRANDVQLTIAKGDASDVAIAWAGGGWIVAWVDTRDGNGEVYATKVDRGLNRIAREERITNAPGDASDVTILARGDDVWLAWADPRESPRDAFADIYLTRLHARDAKADGPDVRVLATAAHSRSPQLVPSGNGALVGWIEEPPSGADTATSQAYGAMFLPFDGQLKPRGEPLRARGADGAFPVALAMESTNSSVHVALARAVGEELWLDTLELGGSNAVQAYPLLALEGPPSLDVSLHVLDGALYFNDDGPEARDRRVRRAVVGWKH